MPPQHVVLLALADWGRSQVGAPPPADVRTARQDAGHFVPDLSHVYVGKQAAAAGMSLSHIGRTDGAACQGAPFSVCPRHTAQALVECEGWSFARGSETMTVCRALVTQEVLRAAELPGSACVAYHEALGHGLEMPHPPGHHTLGVMSVAQYSGRPLSGCHIEWEVWRRCFRPHAPSLLPPAHVRLLSPERGDAPAQELPVACSTYTQCGGVELCSAAHRAAMLECPECVAAMRAAVVPAGAGWHSAEAVPWMPGAWTGGGSDVSMPLCSLADASGGGWAPHVAALPAFSPWQVHEGLSSRRPCRTSQAVAWEDGSTLVQATAVHAAASRTLDAQGRVCVRAQTEGGLPLPNTSIVWCSRLPLAREVKPGGGTIYNFVEMLSPRFLTVWRHQHAALWRALRCAVEASARSVSKVLSGLAERWPVAFSRRVCSFLASTPAFLTLPEELPGGAVFVDFERGIALRRERGGLWQWGVFPSAPRALMRWEAVPEPWDLSPSEQHFVRLLLQCPGAVLQLLGGEAADPTPSQAVWRVGQGPWNLLAGWQLHPDLPKSLRQGQGPVQWHVLTQEVACAAGEGLERSGCCGDGKASQQQHAPADALPE
ncbi:unnamed protein product [Symbiodinium sp. KB8]|nr:unnamed protein product [Symbiodinium sp. KB8]